MSRYYRRHSGRIFTEKVVTSINEINNYLFEMEKWWYQSSKNVFENKGQYGFDKGG